MSAPFDRPAYGNPGGCECFDCGVIFVGAEWHTKCAVCDAQAMSAREGQDRNGLGGDSPASAVAESDAPTPSPQSVSKEQP